MPRLGSSFVSFFGGVGLLLCMYSRVTQCARSAKNPRPQFLRSLGELEDLHTRALKRLRSIPFPSPS